ncbi:protein of unknown function [Nitrospira japonica]|uniref:Uncharacterized protein n=1 Tax=Nitrospira japonica TaxID=1325564 RepID=A0A1W1I523_9BACT|nr:protein of unknown function [Nitrospira japonica]
MVWGVPEAAHPPVERAAREERQEAVAVDNACLHTTVSGWRLSQWQSGSVMTILQLL